MKTADKDGAIIMSMTTSGWMDVKRWILSHGRDARGIEPDSMVKEILSDISYITVLYNEMVDDSGFSPNLTNNGHLIVTGINGEVLNLNASGIKLLDASCYDILPPAVYPDNSLAIAGYSPGQDCKKTGGAPADNIAIFTTNATSGQKRK